MGTKLSTALIATAAVIAVSSLYQARQSSAQIDSLRATVEALEQDAPSRTSTSHRGALDLAGIPAGMSDVEAMARMAARREALRTLGEQDGASDDGSGAEPAPPAITFEESRDRVHQAYEEEPIDSDWSSRAAAELDGSIRQNLPEGSRLRSLDCRSTMCQLELAHRDVEAHNRLLMNGFHDWRGALFVADETPENGEYLVTLFAAREGSELPLAPR